MGIGFGIAYRPGAIATPGTGAGGSANPQLESALEPFVAKVPMHRMGEPDDIGSMTGSQVVVDGGVLLT